MLIPTGKTEFKDLVHGKVVFDNDTVDDQVIMKSDGFPTYHFANVVDDFLMRITHVVRGEEWLPSTPKHLILYKMFSIDPPQFTHLPLLLTQNGQKLSKRHGDVSVHEYREKGYLPSALLNGLALLGWNPPHREDPNVLAGNLDHFLKHEVLSVKEM
jgi:glutamyl/glutaminyl-tRNA synthetase